MHKACGQRHVLDVITREVSAEPHACSRAYRRLQGLLFPFPSRTPLAIWWLLSIFQHHDVAEEGKTSRSSSFNPASMSSFPLCCIQVKHKFDDRRTDNTKNGERREVEDTFTTKTFDATRCTSLITIASLVIREKPRPVFSAYSGREKSEKLASSSRLETHPFSDLSRRKYRSGARRCPSVMPKGLLLPEAMA